MKIDLDKSGLEAFGFKDWQSPLIYKLLTEVYEDEPMKTRDAHEYVRSLGFDRSRASVIFFLQDMEGEGLLLSKEEPGKGGMHSVYWGDKTISDFLADIQLKLRDKIVEYQSFAGKAN